MKRPTDTPTVPAPRRSLRREFVCFLRREQGAPAAGSAGLVMRGEALWFCVDLHGSGPITTVALVGPFAERIFRVPLHGGGEGAAAGRLDGWLAAPETVSLQATLLEGPDVCLEVAAGGVVLRGRLYEVAAARWDRDRDAPA